MYRSRLVDAFTDLSIRRGQVYEEVIAPYDRVYIENALTSPAVWLELRNRLGTSDVIRLNGLIKELCEFELLFNATLTPLQLLERSLDSRWNVYHDIAYTLEDFVSRLYERLARIVLDLDTSHIDAVEEITELLLMVSSRR